MKKDKGKFVVLDETGEDVFGEIFDSLDIAITDTYERLESDGPTDEKYTIYRLVPVTSFVNKGVIEEKIKSKKAK